MSKYPSSLTIIAKALGIFWILDGLLQLQPQMFGQSFVNNILTPLVNNQPSFLQAIITFGIQAWDTNSIVANGLAAILQIGMGILLFFPLNGTRFKIGAYTSIAWGLIVWLCGEGAGLLLTGSASLYAGAPGAVLFYIMLAAFLLMPEKITAKIYPKITAWTLILGSALQLQPLFWTAGGAQQVAMTSTMEPVAALNAFPSYLLNVVATHPITSNVILIAIPFSIGIVLLYRPNRITGTLALIFLFLIWWVGQDFGQLSSIFYNTPTDPQLSPLLGLFLAPLFITADLTKENENRFYTSFIIVGTFIGMLILGIIMYGTVVITLQNVKSTSTPSSAPMQMHMSG